MKLARTDNRGATPSPAWVFAVFLAVFFLLPAVSHAADLSLWHSYRGSEQEALESVVHDWNADHPDVQIEVLHVPHDAFASKLTSAIPRGQGPDLFIHAHERIGDWASSDLIAPLDPYLEDDAFDAFLPITVDALRYDQHVWGLPLAFKSIALFYNRALVDSPPETTDELVDVARRHSSTTGGRQSFGLAYQADSLYFHAPWLFGFGGGIFDDDGEVVLDRPANARSMEFVADLNRREMVPDEPTGAAITKLFNTRRAAMVIQGPWFLGSIDDGVDYGIAPLPEVSATGNPARPFLTVDAAIVSAESDHPEQAVAFARHLAGGPAVETRLREGQQLVATKATWKNPDAELSRDLKAFRRQAERAHPMPNHPLMRSVWEPADRALRSVLRGDRTPEAALEKAQRDFNIVTRPPPDERDPLPYLVLFGLLLLAVAGWLVYRVRQAGGWQTLKDAKTAYAYLAPGGLALVALVFVPFLVGTAVAFFAHSGGEFTFVGLANFWSILSSADYAVSDPLSFYFTLGVTVLWTVLNVALHVSIGLAVAMVLRNSWVKLTGMWRVLLIVPWAVPNYITALIWKGMFHTQFGAINGLLESLGLKAVPWFSNFWTAFAANVTTNTWLGFPFMMVVCLGALQSIPQDLEEAAMMDGAGPWTRFTQVIWPQIKPALVPAIILGSVWTFNMFNIIYLVSGGAPDGSTEILISEAYRWAFSRQEQYGYAAAYATLIFMVLVGYSALTEQFTGRLEDT